MHTGNNRVNTNFQILYFLIGSCHTADGAHSLLLDLREDRSNALKTSKANRLTTEAKILKAKRALNSSDEIEVLLAKADLAEIEAMEQTLQNSLEAAKEELQFIEDCISKIQPYRKYSNLSDREACEAAQQEEWLQELIFRAQNYLMTTGSIHVDHFSTMRMHPEFSSRIIPAISEAKMAIETGTIDKLMNPKEHSPKFLLSSFIKESEESIKLLQKFD